MVRILIAAHKKAKLPQDEIYLPVFVGAANHAGEENLPPYERDDRGDNISVKNPLYCELTGLYYGWKNLNADTLGLVHYRRYFAGKGQKTAGEKDPVEKAFLKILSDSELTEILGRADIILPKKQNYYIETVYSHYAHTHDASQLNLVREIIREKYPEDLGSFDRVMRARTAHMFNMMVMKEPYLSEYLGWLFDLLTELENRFELKETSAYQRRYIGRIAEILINVWLDSRMEKGSLKKEQVAVLPVVYLGRVNWLKKGSAFLRAKFLHRRYKESF